MQDPEAIRLARRGREAKTIRGLALHAAALVLIAGVAGYGPSQAAEVTAADATPPGTALAESGPRTSTRPANPGTRAVTRPGMVLVDHDARRTELESGGDKLCRVWEGDYATTTIPPMVKVMALPEDGIDK